MPDVGALPLHLSKPDGINNGGYPNGYSSVDLAVAGLEAFSTDEKIENLTQYFDKHRAMISESWVHLVVYQYQVDTISDDEVLGTGFYCAWSIVEFKQYIKRFPATPMLPFLRKQAPLTFKWGVS
jgi:hypothetical protein